MTAARMGAQNGDRVGCENVDAMAKKCTAKCMMRILKPSEHIIHFTEHMAKAAGSRWA